MESFLRLTARHLLQQYGDRLSDIAVIFPNNRARLFFSEHLLNLAGRPIWTPSFLTINNLFESQTSLKVPDTLSLVARLYKTFREVSGREESFDEFYLWGELLLSDFDDVDKNLADATQLFRNIREQAAFTDTLEHLSNEQVEVIRRFFSQFDPSRKTELKRRFMENWNCLMQVYSTFREALENEELAYEGMLNRKVVEQLRETGSNPFGLEKYAFVGFNVLNRCEKELFDYLHKKEKALFYWDYDSSYLQVNDHEAGRFMRQNMQRYPNQLDESHFHTFLQEKKSIEFVASASENAQARYLPEWIRSLGATFKPEETAVVLCNESLLLPVLHSIPESVRELNVTMGFPLSQAPVTTLIQRMCILHTSGVQTDKQGEVRFNFRHLLPILQHPMVVMASKRAGRVEMDIRQQNLFRIPFRMLWQDDFLKEVFTPVHTSIELADRLMSLLTMLARKQEPAPEEDNKESREATSGTVETDSSETPADTTPQDDPLFQESIFQCYTLISRLKETLSQGLVEVGMPVFTSLLQRIISVTGIPFSGEPVRGMQIMGMLETRTLDFKNVLILSVNEGMLPKSANDVSFIPYNLRKAFGLSTIEHKDSIFAYYFYRLLQRAERITLAYNTSSEGLNRGEMSRFMLQLLVDDHHPISCHQLHTTMGLSTDRELRVDKSKPILNRLLQRFDTSKGNQTLSPTALNTFINCPLRFYFRYVANLKEQETINDEIDGSMMGIGFHHAAQYIYTDILLRKQGHTPDVLTVEKTIENNQNGMILSGLITADDLKPWMKGERSIDLLANHVMRMDFFKLEPGDESPLEYSGEQLIRLRILINFLNTLLKLDAEAAPFTIKGMERWVDHSIALETAQGPVTFTLGGIIDRLHEKEGFLHVMDYKTGGDPKSIRSIESLFEPAAERPNHVFQILFYCAILLENREPLPLKPDILYVNKAGGEDYRPDVTIEKKPIDQYDTWHEPFMGQLKVLLKRIFDPDIPFVQTKHVKTCAFCPYKDICHR